MGTIVPSTSTHYKSDTNLTANLIPNNPIFIRGKRIRRHEIPKFLSKMCNLNDPKNEYATERTAELFNTTESGTAVSNTKPPVNTLVTKTNVCATMKNAATANTNINTVHCLAYSSFM